MRALQAARARGIPGNCGGKGWTLRTTDRKGVGGFPPPITSGWNRTGRLCRLLKEILDGTWTFPGAQPVK